MADPTHEAPTGKKKSSALLSIAVAVSGMMGVVVATLIVAPRVVASRTAADPVEAGEHEESAPGAGGGHGAPSTAEESGHFVELGNILVNPSGSEGLRFLMTTVAMEVEDEETRTRLRQREAQVRDVVISVLAAQTLQELARPGARDSVKARVTAVMDEVFDTHVRVYLPQFVIN